MRKNVSLRAPRAGRAGFTVVELLLAVTIMAFLMAALAFAMQGVLQAYNVNTEVAEVNQAARVILNRMMMEVRTANEVSNTATYLSILPPTNAQNITEIQYEFLNGALVRRQRVGATLSSIDLIPASDSVKVTAFAISRTKSVDGTYTLSLTADLGLKVGANAIEVNASACPRRNMTY